MNSEIAKERISYYVISDIDSWANNSLNRAELERFDNLSDAVLKYADYRYGTDAPKQSIAAFGMNVNGSEFDLVYAEHSDNVLSLDFYGIIRHEGLDFSFPDAKNTSRAGWPGRTKNISWIKQFSKRKHEPCRRIKTSRRVNSRTRVGRSQVRF